MIATLFPNALHQCHLQCFTNLRQRLSHLFQRAKPTRRNKILNLFGASFCFHNEKRQHQKFGADIRNKYFTMRHHGTRAQGWENLCF